jgi:hypothetical protein
LRSRALRPAAAPAAVFGAALLAAALALVLGSCAKPKPAGEGASGSAPVDTLPPAALTERAQRDSARVAQLALAYFDRLARKRPDDALALFFPESLRVATPQGGIEVEGRSAGAAAQIAAEESSAARVRRIVLLRKSETELLENTYRETWWLRYVPDRADSAVLERRLHVIQQLGNDTRWLGRVKPGP